MKPKVLIVDDDIAITQQLFWTLCDDYEVMTANDLQTAFRRATIYEPVVSIVDLQIPPSIDTPESGLRFLEYIKDRLPDSKVVVISSAAGSVEIREACLKSGADAVMQKPFDVDQLLSTLVLYASDKEQLAVG
jgi:DNA-binding response OmpR family regulator